MSELQLDPINQQNQPAQLSYSKGFKISIFLLRLAVGWLFFYAGLTKILSPNWSAVGYLKSAKTFPSFYNWLASQATLPVVNFLNKWGLLLIGLSLILGLFTRLGSLAGILLMLLYYFPTLQFPYPNPHSLIVDEHIIYALVFLLFVFVKPGQFFGLEKWCLNLPICKKFPKTRNWLR